MGLCNYWWALQGLNPSILIAMRLAGVLSPAASSRDVRIRTMSDRRPAKLCMPRASVMFDLASRSCQRLKQSQLLATDLCGVNKIPLVLKSLDTSSPTNQSLRPLYVDRAVRRASWANPTAAPFL